MADFVDEGNELNEFHLGLALDNHRNRVNVTRENINLAILGRGDDVLCEECGEAIEPRRLQVITDTEHCAECADYLDKKSRQFAR